MTTLASMPTSALLAELNARKQRMPVEVREIAGPTPESPVRHGVFRQGDAYRPGDGRFWRQRYIAMCPSAAEAHEIARLINEADAQRAIADEQ